MTIDVKEMMEDMKSGMGDMMASNKKTLEAYSKFSREAMSAGALDAKTKELIGIGITIFCHCEYCIAHHVHAAFKAGATKEEIMEAAMVGGVFGGGPSMAYSATVLNAAIKEFEAEFAE